jgi:hypothetical protein
MILNSFGYGEKSKKSQSNIRMEQTAAVVTVFAGSKILGKAEQKPRANPAFGRTHRQLIRLVRSNAGISLIDWLILR